MRITRAIAAATTAFVLTAVALVAYHDGGTAGGDAGVIEQNTQPATAVGSVGPKWAACATSKPACEALIATMSAYAVSAPVPTAEGTDARCRFLPEWQRHGALYERMCGDPTRTTKPLAG